MSSAHPHAGSISASVVRGLLAALEQLGVGRRDLLHAAALDACTLSASLARIPRTQVSRLIARALELRSHQPLGLSCSERLDAAAFAPVSHLVSSAGSLRQALRALDRYYRLWSDGADYRVIEGTDQVCLRMTVRFEAPHVQRFAAEMLVASVFRLVLRFCGSRGPDWVSFEHPAPAYREAYTRVFGAETHFDRPFTGLAFDRALLDAASPKRDGEVYSALQALADQRLAQLPNGASYAHRVREILIEQHGPNHVQMTGVAQALGLTSRSLRRYLTTEGKSYQQLAREAAVHMARQLLVQRGMTIQETAHEMGFYDLGSFYRAFKRWTGTTPRKFRHGCLPRIERGAW